MDPRLVELALEGDAGDEVMAVLRLREAGRPPPGVRVVSNFGPIITARLRRGDITRIRTHEAVASMKAPTGVVPEPEVDDPASEALPLELLPGDYRRPGDLPVSGSGCVVGVVDWGFDFTHPNFRHPDGRTRLLALWDQRGDGDPRAPPPYGYGIRYDTEEIDRALAQSDPFGALGYDPSGSDPGGSGSHGTHVADIAAGSGRVGSSGLAPGAELVFVQASAARGGFPALGDSVSLLEAVDFIRKTAGSRPFVVNLSMGNIAGPHDGSTLVELALDEFVAAAPGRAVVQSCGNYFTRDTHVARQLRPGDTLSLAWLMDPADVTPNRIELWYGGGDRLRARLDAPDGTSSGWVALGGMAELRAGDRLNARLYHRASDPNNGDHNVAAFAYPGGPAGQWTITVEGEDVVDGRVHAWIERDEQCAACQSRFPTEVAVRAGTIGTIANGRRTVATGALDAHADGFRLASFSSMGPTRDGRQKPDLVAPGVAVLAARSMPAGGRPGEGLLTRKSGTSMAAPHVTGTVALMFEAARRPLPIQTTRRLLLSASDREDVAPELSARAGSGRLNVRKAVLNAAALPEEDVMAEAITELPAPSAEAVAGQIVTAAGQRPIEVAATPEYSSTTLDDALQFALGHPRGAWLVRGDGFRGAQFDSLRVRGRVDSAGNDVLDADIPGCDAVVFDGEAYIPADLVGRGTRWVRLPRARQFYAQAEADQRDQRRAWIAALAAANPRIEIGGTPVTRAWLNDRSMPTLRGLIARFAGRVLPVRPRNRGAVVNGLTLPLVAFPIREPECYLPVIAAREGKLESINAWDLGAGISLGPIQFNLQRSAVLRMLDRFQARDPALFRELLGADPQRMEVRADGGHTDLVIRTAGGVVETLHGRQADERRNIAWFQSGRADPAYAGAAHIDAAHRQALAARFRDAVAWPHVQDLIVDTSGWWLEPGLRLIDDPANGIPRLDPADPDRTVFTLKALLLSAYVRFSGCLRPLLQALRRWPTPAQKLEHLDGLLADAGVNLGACRQVHRDHLRVRLRAQRPEAGRVHDLIRRLRERQAAEDVEPGESDEGTEAVAQWELEPAEAPCGGEIEAEAEESGEEMTVDDPMARALAALEQAFAGEGLQDEPLDLADWLADRRSAALRLAGAPARTPAATPARGDLLVERALGQGGSDRVGVVTGEGLVGSPPVLVETTMLSGPSASRSLRRVLRSDGRLLPGVILLRPLVESVAEQANPWDCGGGVVLAAGLVGAVGRARLLAGTEFAVPAPPCDPTARCPARLHGEHAGGGATHLVRLDRDQLRTAELAGLWGLDLRAHSAARRSSRPVKLLQPGAPFDPLHFTAIRQGNRREIHVATAAGAGARRVESIVEGDAWPNLAHAAQRRTVPYVLTKRRYSEASLHRQWGRDGTIAWILDLAGFYLSQTGQFLGVGDVSHVAGEVMTDHGSHRTGLDVDLYVVDFPDQSTGIPEMYLCEGEDPAALTLRPLTPPRSSDRDFGAAGAALAGARLDLIRRRYATVVAYCLATWDRVNTCTWHGVTWVLREAQAIATGAARGGWNAGWGPAPPADRPAGPAAQGTLARKLVGQGHGSYGPGRGWPPHRDHLHVRLNP